MEKIPDYKKAFEVMYDFFDCVPDECKIQVDQELRECGL